MAKVVTIFCSIVEQVQSCMYACRRRPCHPYSHLFTPPYNHRRGQSKNTSAVQRGDIVMSVGGTTLVGDEEQSPGGMDHCNACVQILSQAPHPRRIRFFRSRSVNANEKSCTLPAEEAMQVAPMIFNGGDGGQKLMEALKGLGQGPAAAPARDSAPAAPTTGELPRPEAQDAMILRGVIQQPLPGFRGGDIALGALGAPAVPNPYKVQCTSTRAHRAAPHLCALTTRVYPLPRDRLASSLTPSSRCRTALGRPVAPPPQTPSRPRPRLRRTTRR
jgi:hypothetical protein